MTPDFDRARDTAVELLLSQSPPRLPVDPARLQLKRPVRFDTMQRFCRVTRTTLAQLGAGSDCLRDGCTILYRREGVERALVLYNGEMRHAGRRRFTLAHELGHILLGHQEDSRCQETEANWFAVQLLVPDVLLYAVLGDASGEGLEAQLSRRFGVSREMAGNRLADAAKIRRRLTPQEHALREAYRHLLRQESREPLVSY